MISKFFRIHEDRFRVCLGTVVVNRATHCVTANELEFLRAWMQEERKQGDIWQAGRIGGVGRFPKRPRFQVEYHGEWELHEMTPLAFPGEYLFHGVGQGQMEAFNKYDNDDPILYPVFHP